MSCYLSFSKFYEHNTNPDTAVTEANFSAYEKQAERCLNNLTMTVDGVKKLVHYFPVAEDDVEAVEACMTELVNALAGFGSYEAATRNAQASGKAGLIASESSGSESISYVNAGTLASANMAPAEKKAYLYCIAREYLAGAKDANGVNLLYGGPYPCILTQ